MPDPSHIFQIENQTVCGHVFNGLMKYDQATNKIVPDLAVSHSVSADGKVLTFTLSKGVKSESGNEFTANDVKWSWDRAFGLVGEHLHEALAEVGYSPAEVAALEAAGEIGRSYQAPT